jgi:uncharacterized membrane protein YqjE
MATVQEGFGSRLKNLARSLVDLLQKRAELASIELQQEKRRLVSMFIWLGALAVSGILALVLISITIVYAFGENARLIGLIVVSVLYLVIAGGLAFGLMRKIKKDPPPLAGTIEELKKDKLWLTSRNTKS